ncbi:hypothetical protein tb265_08740 [Gemmatimonadetes bacterium T265]|nr:hypothetical protein tb265_08740 [Gemmatimonadetes bacterium T265]
MCGERVARVDEVAPRGVARVGEEEQAAGGAERGVDGRHGPTMAVPGAAVNAAARPTGLDAAAGRREIPRPALPRPSGLP